MAIMRKVLNLSSIATDVLFATDNAQTIGAAASGRPATGYFATSVFSPLIVGGTATTADLTFKTTSGVGTTGADMHFLVGNNGATEAMTILNSGNVGIGTTAPSSKLEVNGANSATIATILSGGSGVYSLLATGRTAIENYYGTAAAAGNMSLGAVAGDLVIRTESKNTLFNTNTGGAAAMYIQATSGNVGIGTTTPGGSTGGTVGTTVLSLGNGTAPVGGVANQVSLYSADVTASAELFALDEAGNAPQLSPHPGDFLNTLPLEGREYPWAYRASNCYLGKQIDVDMMGAIRAIEQLSNKQFIYLSDLAQDKRADWDAVQESHQKEREEHIAGLQKQIADLEQQILYELDEEKRARLGKQRDAVRVPEPYQKKAVPQWMRARGVKSKI